MLGTPAVAVSRGVGLRTTIEGAAVGTDASEAEHVVGPAGGGRLGGNRYGGEHQWRGGLGDEADAHGQAFVSAELVDLTFEWQARRTGLAAQQHQGSSSAQCGTVAQLRGCNDVPRVQQLHLVAQRNVSCRALGESLYSIERVARSCLALWVLGLVQIRRVGDAAASDQRLNGSHLMCSNTGAGESHREVAQAQRARGAKIGRRIGEARWRR